MEEAGENLGAAVVALVPLQKASSTTTAAIFRRLNSLRLPFCRGAAATAAAVFKLPRERCWLS